MYETKYLGRFVGITAEDNLWYKLCVYYHAKTELYDRMLTHLRSPYDPTEAYIQGGVERSLSYANARKIRRFVDRMATGIPENIKHFGLNVNKYHYSAQDWIDIYNKLVTDGEMDTIEMEYEKYENYEEQISNPCIELYKTIQRL